LLNNQFLVGNAVTLADIVVCCSLLNAFKLVMDAAFLAPYKSVVRWFTLCVNQPEFLAVLGPTELKGAGTPAAAPAKPAAEKAPEKAQKAPEKAEKAEKPTKAEKKEKAKQDKKETPKKEEKKPKEKEEAKAADPAADAAKAAKEREKFLAKVIKEGGKKGVEIEGASDMGGLDFFCTTMELPEGDVDLLLLSMEAMNAEPDPEAEDRKGCSGHVGKMIYSAGVSQLAIVAYVPDAKHNKSADKVDVTQWMDHVLKEVGGGQVVTAAAPAKSPNGGKVVVAKVAGNADKGKFPLKDKDTAMAAAFSFLRSKGAFPEDDGDDSDDMVFGDDCDINDY